VTHGLFADDALSHIEESLIELVLTSDTITPTDAVKRCKKICVVPTVSAFSAALTKLFGASE
jgi:ribose-phosphate pyrophosphokinase